MNMRVLRGAYFLRGFAPCAAVYVRNSLRFDSLRYLAGGVP